MTPDLYGRADLEKHPTSVAVAQNFLLHVQGGLFSRPGLKLVAVRKNQQARVALARFVFSPTDKCVVEFGPGYIRFLTKQGYVTKGGVIYEIPSPYTEEDFTYLNYDQSGDVLYLACKGQRPKTLTRYADTDWRLEDYQNQHGPFDTDKGDRAALASRADGSWLLTQLTGYQFAPEDVGSYFKLEREFDAQSFSFTQSNSTTAAALLEKVFLCCSTWRLDTTGTWTGTIKVQYSEDGLTWRDYRSYSATNTANINTSGEVSGTIRYLRIDTRSWTSGTAYIQFRVDAFTYNLFGRVETVNSENEAVVSLDNLTQAAQNQVAGENAQVVYTDYALPVLSSNTEPEGEAFYQAPGYRGAVLAEDGTPVAQHTQAYLALDGQTNTAATVPAYVFSAAPKLGYKFESKKRVTGVSVRVAAPETDLIMTAWVYSATAGWREAGSTELAAGTEATATLAFGQVICDAVAVDFRAVPPAAEEEEETEESQEQLPSATVQVQAMSFAQLASVSYNISLEAKFYAPSWGKRQGWPQAVGFYQGRLGWYKGYRAELSKTDDFDNFEVSLKVQDDDAVQTLAKASGMCDIRYALAVRRLILLTDGGEYVNTADVITPASSGIIQQSNYGTEYVRPLVIGSRVLFVQLMGGRLLDLQYDYASDNWQADDLCALAPHLFFGRTIVQMEYQTSPQGIVWVLLDDGTVLSLSYSRQHEVLAWTRQQTDGTVEALCVLPGDGENEVFMAVNRGGVRTVEVMASQRPVQDRAQAVCVDSAVVRSWDTPGTEVDGLEHLEGRTVKILADGNVRPDAVVSGGKITLDAPASRVVVGLPLRYQLTTLPLVIPTQEGDYTGRLKPESCLVGVTDSAGGYAGQSGQKLDPMLYGEDGKLFTGTVRVNLSAVSQEDPQLVLSGEDPLPLNVTKITTVFK